VVELAAGRTIQERQHIFNAFHGEQNPGKTIGGNIG
jgi:hypothetical protein